MARALIVGINHYANSPLTGCVNDATVIQQLISKHGNDTINFHCKLMVSDGKQQTITLRKLREQLQHLFQDPDERVLFYFAGHGYEDNLGGYLVTQDAQRYAEGLALSELLAMANNALRSRRIQEVILILDCCHAGHLGDMIGFDHLQSLMAQGLSILTSCSSDQLAAEDNRGGLFTRILGEGLRGGAADIRGRITVASLYNYVDQMLDPWQQRPQFKTHASRMHVIRNIEPKISMKDLRNLPLLFPQADYRLRLDPTWEVTDEKALPENIEKFNLLKRYRDVGMLQVIAPHEDLYWAAVHSGQCQLTLPGQLYWEMIAKGIH